MRYAFLIWAISLCWLTGCGPRNEMKPLTAEEQLAQERALEAMQQLSDPGRFAQTNARAVVYKAFDDLPLADADGNKRIAVDIVFQPIDGAIKNLDLQHINILEGESGELAAVRPTVQRLTPEGKPADDNDPIFAGQQDFRCLLMYVVPQTWGSVRLEYWDEQLTADAIPLEHGAPPLPQPALVVDSIMAADPDNPDGDTYIVLLECRDWSRVQLPNSMELRCLVDGNRSTGVLDALLEMDAQSRPLREPLEDRPLYVPVRRFLARFRTSEGATVLDLKSKLGSHPLPRPKSFSVPDTTLAELDLARIESQP